MKNIEIKVPLEDRSRVETVLRESSAELVWTRQQRDTFYGVKTGWLKLREEQGDDVSRAELIAYYRTEAAGGLKTSNYDIRPLDDGPAWREFLARSHDVEAVVAKERTLWMWDHTRVHLDRVEGLGDYLELETVAREISTAEAEDEAARIVEALGLDVKQSIDVPYRELLLGH